MVKSGSFDEEALGKEGSSNHLDARGNVIQVVRELHLLITPDLRDIVGDDDRSISNLAYLQQISDVACFMSYQH